MDTGGEMPSAEARVRKRLFFVLLVHMWYKPRSHLMNKEAHGQESDEESSEKVLEEIRQKARQEGE